MKTRIVCVMNQKGGVGKTTTTLNLGAALALKGKKVLLIDLDPQANLTRGLGLRAKDLSESIYELLINPNVDVRKLIKHSAYENLDLVPSHIDVSGAEIELVPVMGREMRLKRALAPIIDEYDYIYIDCLPSLSLLTVNAMVAANEALVPLQAHPFALEGLGKLFEIAAMLREALNPELRVTGVLVTLYDSRTNVSKETLQFLHEDERLAPHLFKTTVRMNIKIAESQKDGIPVIHFDPRSHGAQAYMDLADEVLEMERSGCLASEARDRVEQNAGAPDHTVDEAEEADEDEAREVLAADEPPVEPVVQEEPPAEDEKPDGDKAEVAMSAALADTPHAAAPIKASNAAGAQTADRVSEVAGFNRIDHDRDAAEWQNDAEAIEEVIIEAHDRPGAQEVPAVKAPASDEAEELDASAATEQVTTSDAAPSDDSIDELADDLLKSAVTAKTATASTPAPEPAQPDADAPPQTQVRNVPVTERLPRHGGSGLVARVLRSQWKIVPPRKN